MGSVSQLVLSRPLRKAIFPGRKIGRLEEGHEASFLVLGGDPLADFGNVQSIKLRVKQGVRLDHPAH